MVSKGMTASVRAPKIEKQRIVTCEVPGEVWIKTRRLRKQAMQSSACQTHAQFGREGEME